MTHHYSTLLKVADNLGLRDEQRQGPLLGEGVSGGGGGGLRLLGRDDGHGEALGLGDALGAQSGKVQGGPDSLFFGSLILKILYTPW